MIKTPLSTVIGGAFWTPGATIIAATFEQRIKKLFANGEQGFWYDPNDMGTMFQDAAGTVPVTGAGQAVGLILDKSRGLRLGQNMAKASTIQGVPLGGSPLTNYTVADNLIVGRVYSVQITVSNYSGTDSLGVSGTMSDAFVLIPASTRLKSGNGIISFICVAGSTSQNVSTRSTNTAVFENIQIREILGNHAYQSTSAARPILRKNAVTGAYYLEFDGTDDSLQTNNIDFTATDKVSLFTGIRKLSDTYSALCFELGDGASSSLNAFALFAPAGSGTLKYDLRNAVTATGAGTTDIKFNAPNSAVLSGVVTPNNTDKVLLRINSRLVATTQTGRAGNLIAAPLYIGRRAGTSLPFNGNIYGLIGVGKLAPDRETVDIEKELAKRVGVTLNV